MRFLWIFAFLFAASSAFAQSHSQFFDYTGYNVYWNGANWTSYATGYGNVLGPNTSTGDFTFYTTGSAASAGLTRTLTPVMAVTAAGTVSATAFVGNGSGLTGITSTPGGSTTQMQYNNGGTLAGGGVYYVSGTGAVGIGTSAPSVKLHIQGGGLLVLSSTDPATAVAAPYIQSQATSGFSSSPVYSFWYQSGLGISNPANNVLGFVTSASERMRIDSSGNVGIGTNTPAAKLHLFGGANVDPSLTYGAPASLIVNAGSADLAFGSVLTGGPWSAWIQARAWSNTSNPLVLNPLGGNVGISTTSPNATLDVNGTVSATNIKTAGTLTYGAYSSQPVACSASYKGMAAMSNTLNDLCLCTGTAWVRVGSGGTACTW